MRKKLQQKKPQPLAKLILMLQKHHNHGGGIKCRIALAWKLFKPLETSHVEPSQTPQRQSLVQLCS